MIERRMSFTDLVGLKIEDVTFAGNGVAKIKLSNGKKIFMHAGSVVDQAGNTLEAK